MFSSFTDNDSNNTNSTVQPLTLPSATQPLENITEMIMVSNMTNHRLLTIKTIQLWFPDVGHIPRHVITID